MSLRFSRLDRSPIRKLQPGEKLTEHGITAERVADGDLRYSVNVMVDGFRIHRVIGKEKEGVTRTQAEEFIEKVRTECARRSVVADEAPKASAYIRRSGGSIPQETSEN